MSTISDVQALYGTVRSTWEKSQAHVVAHVVFLLLVFAICGATMPLISFPRVDPKLVMENDWFKLAKDSGIIYASFVIPLLLIAVYAAVLRVGGQWLVTLLMLVMPPRMRAASRLENPWFFEPVALTLGTTDFDFSDLNRKSTELSQKYESQKNERWKSLEESLGGLTKNSLIYLGDFLLFLLFWVGLFRFFPAASWVQDNEARFWPVAMSVIALVWFAWFRVSHAIGVLPSLRQINLAEMLRSDPEISPLLNVPEEIRKKVNKRLRELLEEKHKSFSPSLLGFVAHITGLIKRPRTSGATTFRGVLFPKLYDEGLRFSWDTARNLRYDHRWIGGYFSYLYYRLHWRVTYSLKSLWQLIRYVVTGAP